MILSMTGFASTSEKLQVGILTLELRAVNHRYLDIQLRLPDEMRCFEAALREQIAANVSRGKIDCKISIKQNEQSLAGTSNINENVLLDLFRLSHTIVAHNPQLEPLSVAQVLAWPGVLCQKELAAENLLQVISNTLAKALELFVASKAREGEKLKQVILSRCVEMEKIIAEISPKLSVILDDYLSKLSTRLREALTNIDNDRLQQEFTFFAQKIDIAEEIQRLSTHLIELHRILNAGGPSGKRLDFLMQELNREANTLGSKSVSIETSKASMELKVLIEQMREQIQNIE